MIAKAMTLEQKRDADLRLIHDLMRKHDLKTFEITEDGFRAQGAFSVTSQTVEGRK